jgi:hypothetical protein
VNYQYNPYAAPAAPPPVQAAVASGSPQPWGVGEVVSIAWDRFKSRWPVVVLSYFVTVLMVEVVAMVPNVLQLLGVVDRGSGAAVAIAAVFSVLQLALSFYLNVGMMRIWLEVVRGGSPEFGTLFSGADRLLPFLAVQLLYGLAVLLGLIALIVPAVILGLGLSLGMWYVVDAKMGPIEALSASWQATKGHKGDLFVLGLVTIGLGILGLLMCGIGLLATVPLSYLAYAVAYTRMSGIGVVTAGPPR